MSALHEDEGTRPASPAPHRPLQRKSPNDMKTTASSSISERKSAEPSDGSPEASQSTSNSAQKAGSCPLKTELCRFDLELKMRITAYGECHPKVAETMNILGLYHRHMAKDMERALWYHTQALHVLKGCKCEGSSVTEDIAVTLTDIGSIKDITGDYNGALASFSEALQLFENVEPKLDETDPRMFSILRCMDRVSRNSHARR